MVPSLARNKEPKKDENYPGLPKQEKCKQLIELGKIIHPQIFFPEEMFMPGYFLFSWGGEPRIIVDNGPYKGRDLHNNVDSEGRPDDYGEEALQEFLSRKARETVNTDQREVARNAIAGEYKIHLMPKMEYIPAVTEELCRGFSEGGLIECASTFKIKKRKKTSRDEVMPRVVIYSQYGRENAQKTLDWCMEHFGQWENVANGEIPRFNRVATDLIFYSQSGGDFKGKYLRENGRNTMFTMNLSHINGHQKLDINRTYHPDQRNFGMTQDLNEVANIVTTADRIEVVSFESSLIEDPNFKDVLQRCDAYDIKTAIYTAENPSQVETTLGNIGRPVIETETVRELEESVILQNPQGVLNLQRCHETFQLRNNWLHVGTDKENYQSALESGMRAILYVK